MGNRTASRPSRSHNHKASYLGGQSLGICLQLSVLLAGCLPCVRRRAQVRWGEEEMGQRAHKKAQSPFRDAVLGDVSRAELAEVGNWQEGRKGGPLPSHQIPSPAKTLLSSSLQPPSCSQPGR